MINMNLRKYKELFKGYTELRVQNNSIIKIGFINGDLVTNVKSSTSGVSSRANIEGSWGFASNSNISDDSIREIITMARENGELLNRKERKIGTNLQVSSYTVEKFFGTKKRKCTQREIIDYLKELDNYIITKYKNLEGRQVYFNNLTMEKNLLTSSDAQLYSFVPRSMIYITLIAKDKDGNPIENMELFGGLGDFEDLFTNPEQLYESIDNMYKQLMDQKTAIYADAGLKECIIAPEMTGILAHEAIGHTTEADFVLSGSIAGTCLNETVASPIVTLKDFAHSYDQKICPIPMYIDDEGTTCQDVTIIENGVLKGYMHNKSSANMFNVAPTGNGRAYMFSDEPLIRMRNTAILPGKDKLKDIIASIEDGYYLLKVGNGQADATSEFMFGVPMGYEIKNGKLGRAIKNTTVSGVAFNVLKTVTMVSDEFTWVCGGMCGKKQPIPVGMGGPSIKCKINIGGK